MHETRKGSSAPHWEPLARTTQIELLTQDSSLPDPPGMALGESFEDEMEFVWKCCGGFLNQQEEQ
jgi:hypothetical protein